MAAKSLKLLFLIVFLIASPTGEAFQCYKCDDCVDIKSASVETCETNLTSLTTENTKEASSFNDTTTISVSLAATLPANADSLGLTSINPTHSKDQKFWKTVLGVNDKYNCFKISYTDDNVDKVKRGCVDMTANFDVEKMCKELNNGRVYSKCNFCDGTSCNPATRVVLKVFVLTLPVALAFVQ